MSKTTKAAPVTENKYIEIRTTGAEEFDLEIIRHESEINQSELQSVILKEKKKLTEAKKSIMQLMSAPSIIWSQVKDQQANIQIAEKELEIYEKLLKEYF